MDKASLLTKKRTELYQMLKSLKMNAVSKEKFKNISSLKKEAIADAIIFYSNPSEKYKEVAQIDTATKLLQARMKQMNVDEEIFKRNEKLSAIERLQSAIRRTKIENDISKVMIDEENAVSKLQAALRRKINPSNPVPYVPKPTRRKVLRKYDPITGKRIP